MWPEIKFSESWDDSNNQKLCPFDKYKCLSRKFKFRPRNWNASTRTTIIYKPITICAHYVYGIHRRPKMDWAVNDGLYHRFLKWKLKCGNILDCELAMLPDSKKCKKVVAWRFGSGMDQYVSWCLPAVELNLDTIWSRYEEFCKPQANEVWASLTCFQAFTRATDQWMGGTMLYKLRYVLLDTHKKLQTSSIMTYFGFSWKMKNLCLKPSLQQYWSWQVSSKQSQAACKENGGIKGNSTSYQASCKWPPSHSNQFDETSVDRPPTKQT